MIHFHLGRFFGTVKDTYGIALAENDGLRLTFHSEDEDEVDIMKTEVEEVVIPWSMIQQVESKKGFIENEITIRLSRLFNHKDLPINKDKELELDVRRKERQFIEPFIKTCRARMSGTEKDDIDSILDDTRDFLNDL